MSARAALKGLAEHGAHWSGANRWSRWRRRRDVVILAYHNIVPHGERATGDRSLHLTQRAFATQLDQLLDTHEVVSLTAVLAGAPPDNGGTTGRPRAVVTFDDAYRGAVTAGVAELRARGIPATIFVAPQFVNGGTFWWDMFASDEGLDSQWREYALTACMGKQDDITRWASTQGIAARSLPPHMACADETELHTALAHTGLSLGSHTWSHPNLAELGEDALRHELLAPRRWLTRFGDRVVDAITYPYGRATERTWHAAFDAGYHAGYLIEGGWMKHRMAPSSPDIVAVFTQPRLNVAAGVSAEGFAMRSSGLLVD